MAIIECPECKKEISDKANVCVHCGFPIKEYLENNAEKEEKISAINAKVQIAEMEYRKYIADVFEKCIDRYVASVEVLEKEQTKRLQLILKFFQEENEKFLTLIAQLLVAVVFINTYDNGYDLFD